MVGGGGGKQHMFLKEGYGFPIFIFFSLTYYAPEAKAN